MWGRYPGHGPFSYLPPWERPGWVYGRGRCWRYPYYQPAYGQYPEYGLPKDEEIAMLKNEQQALQARLKEIEERLNEMEK